MQDSAPNPFITIENIGPIGLPLGQRDAAAIKSVAKQVQFGKSQRKGAGKSVKDAWEVDSKQVSIILS